MAVGNTGSGREEASAAPTADRAALPGAGGWRAGEERRPLVGGLHRPSAKGGREVGERETRGKLIINFPIESQKFSDLFFYKHESRKTGLEDVVTVRCKKLVTVQADNSESFRERLGPIYNLKVQSSEFVINI